MVVTASNCMLLQTSVSIKFYYHKYDLYSFELYAFGLPVQTLLYIIDIIQKCAGKLENQNFHSLPF